MTVLVAVAISSCGAAPSHPNTATKAKAPVITPRRAANVVTALQNKRVAAFSSEDRTALQSIDANPELSIDQEAIAEAKAGNGTLSDAAYSSAEAIVPKQTAYPAWFMAIVRDTGGNRALDLFTRSSASTPWLMAAETGLQVETIPWQRAKGGWAVAVQPETDPSQTLADYWNQATQGRNVSGSGVAPGASTSTIASEITQAISSNATHGWAQVAGFAASGPLPETVKLNNGTNLSLAWVTEVLKTRAAYGGCFPQPGSGGFRWDAAVPDGNYVELDITHTYLEGMEEPVRGDLQALTLEEATTAVAGTSCTG